MKKYNPGRMRLDAKCPLDDIILEQNILNIGRCSRCSIAKF